MYEIFTDTAANLDCSLLEELGVGLIPFSFYYNGEEHRVTSLQEFDGHAYYDMMRAGTDVTTSLVQPQRYIDGFTPLLAEGRDLDALYLTHLHLDHAGGLGAILDAGIQVRQI